MTDYALPLPPVTSLLIAGSDQKFPVRRVYCIGRNYAEHAIEMGHDPDREPPFFFQKNPDNLNTSGRFPYPTPSQDVHHEVELAIALGAGGRDIDVDDAQALVFGYAVSLDMTRRDLQGVAKKAGRPWEIGKAFEHSAPIGPLHRVGETGVLTDAPVWLAVNGEIRQAGNINQMIWKVPEMIAYLSQYFELAPGDVILSGTPAGVAAVQKGDKMVATVEGLSPLSVEVT